MSSEATACFSNPITDILPTEKSPSQFETNVELSRSGHADGSTILSDENLVVQVREGSREALTFLFRRHAHTVLNVATRILRDEAEAEDLLQDVFVFVAQRATLFDPTKSSVVSWIIQVAYHRAIDRRRYLSRRNHYEAQEFRDDVLYWPHQESIVNGIGCRGLLNKFRHELTPDQRQTLELHFFEGYTFHEIAGKTGQTLGNVRHHHYRGLERLRALVLPRKRD